MASLFGVIVFTSYEQVPSRYWMSQPNFARGASVDAEVKPNDPAQIPETI